MKTNTTPTTSPAKVRGSGRQTRRSTPATHALRLVRELVLSIRGWPGLSVLPDPKGVRIEADGVTIGRLHLTGLVEAHVGQELGPQLLIDGSASRHPERPNDTRCVVHLVRRESDIEGAAWLLRLAYLALDPELSIDASDIAGTSLVRAA